MNIVYKNIKNFDESDIKKLFSTVNWQASRHLDKVALCLENMSKVISAWEGDKLVGLCCSLDDGVMTAYIHYLLVLPEYQNKGIGTTLLKKTLAEYESFFRVELIAEKSAVEYYEKLGFVDVDALPMVLLKGE